MRIIWWQNMQWPFLSPRSSWSPPRPRYRSLSHLEATEPDRLWWRLPVSPRVVAIASPQRRWLFTSLNIYSRSASLLWTFSRLCFTQPNKHWLDSVYLYNNNNLLVSDYWSDQKRTQTDWRSNTTKLLMISVTSHIALLLLHILHWMCDGDRGGIGNEEREAINPVVRRWYRVVVDRDEQIRWVN